MSDHESGSNHDSDPTVLLQQNADRLQREIAEIRMESDSRLIRAELKAEAIRAGIIDIDGLKLVDTSSLIIQKDGSVIGATALMEQFRKAKPWLFGAASSSNSATPPPAQPPRTKLATEMTDSGTKLPEQQSSDNATSSLY